MKKMLANYETQEVELKFLRNQHAKNHRMFSVKLCSFEPIENTDSFDFGVDGSVKFTGKDFYFLSHSFFNFFLLAYSTLLKIYF